MATARSVEIFQYNAFTDRPFAGNPAAVVTDAAGLDDEVMQRIALQLNLAETAFLMPPSDPDADVRLRWFTPTQEVTLCGHATIAAFTAAAERGVLTIADGEERVLRVETLSGLLRITITRGAGISRVAMQLPLPSFVPLDIDRRAFARLWGLAADELAGELLANANLNYWYLPVADLTALRRLTLDAQKLAAIDASAAFAFHTNDTVEEDSDWHLRFFAPFHGVPEDVVTGSAQGPMGVLQLERAAAATGDGWFEFKGEQGDHLGRPGRVRVRVKREAGKVGDLEIAGGAVSMLEGSIRI